MHQRTDFTRHNLTITLTFLTISDIVDGCLADLVSIIRKSRDGSEKRTSVSDIILDRAITL